MRSIVHTLRDRLSEMDVTNIRDPFHGQEWTAKARDFPFALLR